MTDGEPLKWCQGFPDGSSCWPLETGRWEGGREPSAASGPAAIYGWPFVAAAIARAPTLSSKFTFTSSPVLSRPKIAVGGLIPKSVILIGTTPFAVTDPSAVSEEVGFDA